MGRAPRLTPRPRPPLPGGRRPEPAELCLLPPRVRPPPLTPSAHYFTLKHVAFHLRLVARHAAANKMDARNLAISPPAP